MNATTTNTTTTTTNAEVSHFTLLYRQMVGLLATHATALALAAKAPRSSHDEDDQQNPDKLPPTSSDYEGATAAAITLQKPSYLPSYQVVQHLFQGKGRHPGYVPVSLVSQQLLDTRRTHQQSPSSLLVRDNPLSTGSNAGNYRDDVFLPCCYNCGWPLQPGYNGTSLRLVRTTQPRVIVTRSKRRRASRKLSQWHRRHQQLHQTSQKRPSRTGVVSSSSSSPPPPPPLDKSASSNLGIFCSDPTAPVNAAQFKNALVIQCGICGSKGTLPGLARKKLPAPPPPPSREKNPKRRPSFGASAASKKKRTTLLQAPPTRLVRPTTTGPPAGDRDCDDDFLRLPPPPPLPHHNNPPRHQPALRALGSGAPSQQPSQSSQPQQQRVLLSRSAAKKQHKNNPRKSNKLMDFLSSLND